MNASLFFRALLMQDWYCNDLIALVEIPSRFKTPQSLHSVVSNCMMYLVFFTYAILNERYAHPKSFNLGTTWDTPVPVLMLLEHEEVSVAFKSSTRWAPRHSQPPPGWRLIGVLYFVCPRHVWIFSTSIPAVQRLKIAHVSLSCLIQLREGCAKLSMVRAANSVV